MTTESHDLSYQELLALLADDPGLLARLMGGERLRVVTPFSYPGRLGPVVVHLGLVPEAQKVRLSDDGDLVKCLAEQGMELEIDMILSRTVFHAVREVEGTGISGGHVYLDTKVEGVGAGLWRFLQMVAEVLGLRHAKYKDALTQLERRRDAESNITGWRPT
jgi:hypothetical protein